MAAGAGVRLQDATGRRRPSSADYLRFQRAAITRYFAELADYAREYAASQGRSVLVSGNFFNLLDQYYALEPKVDLIITEMRNTRYRQPAWYRYVAGFAGPKPVVVVENPYGGVVPEMVAEPEGRQGVRPLPHVALRGGGAGSEHERALRRLAGQHRAGRLLPAARALRRDPGFPGRPRAALQPADLATRSPSSTASRASSSARRGATRSPTTSATSATGGVPFWQVCEALCDAAQPYDVLFFPDGELRPDALTIADLDQYRTLILPDCHVLTRAQAALLTACLDGGKSLVALGDLGVNLPEEVTRPILHHTGTLRGDGIQAFALDTIPGRPQVRVAPEDDLMLNVQRTATGAALHVIRYAYHLDQDRTPSLPELNLELRLPERLGRLTAHSPGGKMRGELEIVDSWHRIRLRDTPLYGIVSLERV